MSKLTKEIEKALEGATPGPWGYTKGESSEVYAKDEPRSDNWVCQLWYKDDENMDNYHSNAHLIANAPTWLSQLLEEREQMVYALELISLMGKKDGAIAYEYNGLNHAKCLDIAVSIIEQVGELDD